MVDKVTVTDFSIKDKFIMLGSHNTHVCMVTDVGSRTLTYIVLDKDDHSWYNGPPYVVVEHVADEADMEIITKIE